MEDKLRCCCFFGHRKIVATDELRKHIYDTIEDLVKNKNVDTFLFGDKVQFDGLCYKAVTSLKKIYPSIRRIYVRDSFPDIDDSYKNYLLKRFEDTYYPQNIKFAGRSVYAERNYEMINRCKYCIVYYDESYVPLKRKNSRGTLTNYHPKSGTKIAYEYAIKRCTVINVRMKLEHELECEKVKSE